MNGVVDVDEVTRTLRAHPGLHEVAVIAVGGRLVAGVLAVDDPGLAAGLRAFAAARLPWHAVPTVWVVGLDVPATPHGTVDVDRLRALCSGEGAAPT